MVGVDPVTNHLKPNLCHHGSHYSAENRIILLHAPVKSWWIFCFLAHKFIMKFSLYIVGLLAAFVIVKVIIFGISTFDETLWKFDLYFERINFLWNVFHSQHPVTFIPSIDLVFFPSFPVTKEWEAVTDWLVHFF